MPLTDAACKVWCMLLQKWALYSALSKVWSKCHKTLMYFLMCSKLECSFINYQCKQSSSIKFLKRMFFHNNWTVFFKFWQCSLIIAKLLHVLWPHEPPEGLRVTSKHKDFKNNFLSDHGVTIQRKSIENVFF